MTLGNTEYSNWIYTGTQRTHVKQGKRSSQTANFGEKLGVHAVQ